MVIRSWRRLTGGRGVRDAERRTLVGCSGGADSSALLLALAAASPHLVVGHVVHDLRPREQAEGDARAVEALAGRLGLRIVRAEVRVRAGRGNAEARARTARYAALDRMAVETGCPFVAVGHHGDDQAETVLMGLLRGAGARGLAGVAERRDLKSTTLIRPMLSLTRADSREICGCAGWAWREDAMNADTLLLRGAVRHGLLPVAERLRPGAAERIARTAALLRDAAGLIGERSDSLWSQGVTDEAGSVVWDRASVARERPVVIGELLRRASAVLGGGKGADRMGYQSLHAVVRAIRDANGRPRAYSIGGLRIEVSAETVSVRRGRRDG